MNFTKLLSTVGLALGLCQFAHADLIHRYSFATDASDSIGGEKFKGTLVGSVGGGPTIAGGQLRLNNPNTSPGGGNYLNLPPGILPTSGSATIEEWFTFTTSGYHTEAFAFVGATEPGSNNGQYLMATISAPQGGPVPGQGGSHIGETLAGFDGGETDAYETTPGMGKDGGGYLDDGQTYMLAVVIDAKAGTLSYYLNGKLQQSVAAIPLGDYQFAQAYLGRSPFPDDNATSGSIDEFRIYNDAQSAEAIANQYALGPDAVAGAAGTAVAAAPEPKSSKHGGVGLGTWATQVQYTNVVVTKNGQVLFQSDFDQHFGDWQTGNGSWSANNGLLSQTSSDTDCRATAGKADWNNYTISVRARKTEGDEGFLIMFNVQDKDNWTWWNIGGWGNTQEAIENCVNGEKASLGERSPYEVKAGEWYDLRVEIEGLTIRCYINNTLVRTATYPWSADADTATAASAAPEPVTPAVAVAPAAPAATAAAEPKNSRHGGIGLGTWATQVQYTNVVVTKNGQVLFQSDFDQHFGDWQVGDGSWSAGNGLLSQTSSDTDCRATAGKADWSNYTLSVRARKTEGDEGFLIMFNVQDKDNWTWWNIGGWSNTKEAIENCESGQKTSLGESAPYEVKAGEWYDLRVEVSGTTIRCYINNALIRTATYPGSADADASAMAPSVAPAAPEPAAPAAPAEPSNSKHGSIGLGTWATQVQYTNVVVTKNGQVLFRSDFDQHFGDWQIGNGSWSANSGLLSQTASDTDCRATAGKADWSNYTLSVRARKTQGDEGFLIMFNVQDNDNWTWWNIGGWSNAQEAIENCVNGQKSSLGERVPYEVRTGEWYDLRVEIEGPTIRGYINNVLVRTATYP